MCSLTTGCVLLLQDVFSYYRMYALTTGRETEVSLRLECVLLLYDVFSYYKMCSLTTGCMLVLQDVKQRYLRLNLAS